MQQQQHRMQKAAVLLKRHLKISGSLPAHQHKGMAATHCSWFLLVLSVAKSARLCNSGSRQISDSTARSIAVQHLAI